MARLRVAVGREEKWYPTILRVICLYLDIAVAVAVTIQAKMKVGLNVYIPIYVQT